MPRTPGSGNSRAKGKGHVEDGGRNPKYTAEQVSVLESLYQGCTKPNLSERQGIILKYPVLATLDQNQIKAWFWERRNRDKRKNTPAELQAVNRKLLGANKLLGQENDRLQQVVRRLMSENEYLRHHKENVAASNVDSTVNSHHLNPEASTRTRILSLAETTLTEFLSKATGSDVDWVQIWGMKTGSDLVRYVSILRSRDGAAARACCYVPLDPTKVIEIIKDHSSWFRDCRRMDNFLSLSSDNEGTIELVYMQLYALTTLTSARDLWTLRYTTALEDGSLVVCQRSISGTGVAPDSPHAIEFQRAKMLASGYLIQPCLGGGSIVTIVDHFDSEEASSVCEILQPIYVSSKLVAQRMTVTALDRIVQEAEERNGEMTQSLGTSTMQPARIRSLSQSLSRIFNDAINGFVKDNWLIINHGPSENMMVSTKTTKKFSTDWDCSEALPSSEGILCVKASILIENVSPMLLVHFLKEKRSEWWEFKGDNHSAESFNYGSLAFPGLNAHLFEDGVELSNARSADEILEVIRLKGQTPHQRRPLPPQDLYLLQISNGFGESAVGACSELIFAPVDESPPDDPQLLSSGFRILSLESNTDINGQAQQTMDLASSSVGPLSSAYGSCSVLIVAFQFPFESHRLDYVAYMAQNYVGHVISYVRDFCSRMEPSRFNPHVEPELTPGSLAMVTLATDICQSYSLKFGNELLREGLSSGEAVVEHLWYHQDAILCWSFKPVSVCIYANLSAYNMLDASLVNLHDIKPDQIFGRSFHEALHTVMKEGYVKLGGGTCTSLSGISVKYDRVVVWTVEEGTSAPTRLAFAFSNWSQGLNYG